MALIRGTHASAARTIDVTQRGPREFSGFSQNGEDGILDVLSRRLKTSNRYFLEIGAADGLENNTTWLSITRRYSGLRIEGDPEQAGSAATLFGPLNYGVQIVQQFVTAGNVSDILARAPS